jgi:hypothetical protein
MDSYNYAAQSKQAARAVHSKLQEMTNDKGVIVMTVVALLVVMVIVLAYYVHKYKTASTSSSSFGNHSQWHLGSGDSGNGGNLTRNHASALVPSSHAGVKASGAGKGFRSAAPSGACAAGETAVSYTYPARQVITSAVDSTGAPVYTTVPGGTAVECVSSGSRPDIGGDPSAGKTCGRPWSSDAVSEVQALASIGGFQHDTYGEAMLQSHVGGSPSSAHAPLTDSDLESIMHNGGKK